MSEKDLLGTRIGHIRIVDLLGKGGMGSVYVGFDEKLERRVALKAIRHDERRDANAKARFLREARVLSKLEHPNICQIHDYLEGDENDFLVLELIKGHTLRHKLKDGVTKTDAMRFGIQIAEVLQAAHAGGVVHRDLKPANIMVTDAGEVKVLDFGLSRFVEDRLGGTLSLTNAFDASVSLSEIEVADGGSSAVSAKIDSDRTDYVETKLGTVMGTLSHMSPEQARGEAVGPASDMYSFGLVLHEMFTNSPAYQKSESAAIQLSRARGADTRPITGLGGDLTELIGRLESLEPGARPSAQDAGEHLKRVRDKPKRRAKRVGVAAALVILASFSGVMAFQSARIAAERDRAETALARASQEAAVATQVADFLAGLFRVSDPAQSRGQALTARSVLDRGAERIDAELGRDPALQARLLMTMGDVYKNLGDLARAEELLTRSVEMSLGLAGPDDANTLRASSLLGHIYDNRGKTAESETLLTSVLSAERRVLGVDHPSTLTTLARLANVYDSQGRYEKAGPLMRDAFEQRQRALGPEHPDTLGSMYNLAIADYRARRFKEAETLLLQAAASFARVNGGDHPNTLIAKDLLAEVILEQGRAPDARQLYEEVYEVRRRVLGPEHPDTLGTQLGLANVIVKEGNFSRAETLIVNALKAIERIQGADHTDVMATRASLATMLSDAGRYDESERLWRGLLTQMRRVLGPDHPDIANCLVGLALIDVHRGHPDAAARLLEEAVRVAPAWASSLADDSAWASLKGTPAFEKLISAAKTQPR